MTTALDLVHAQRGMLLRLQKEKIVVEARAQAGPDRVVVDMHSFVPSHDDIPLSLVEEVVRTGAVVQLDADSPASCYSTDRVLHAYPPCAVVIVPLLKREALVGMLYLERQIAATKLTGEPMRFLELLAGQAAVSLETARLYAATAQEVNERRQVEKALIESRAMLLLGERINQSGSWSWDLARGVVHCSAEFCRIYEFDPYVSCIELDALMQYIHPDDREHVIRTRDEAAAAQRAVRFDHRIFARNGEVRYLSVVGHPILETNGNVYAGTVTDVSRRRTDELAQSRAQAELARGARLATISQMTALIAHEVNQPLMSISSNAGAALIGIERDSFTVEKYRQLLREIVEQSQRAGAIIQTLQAMTYRGAQPEPVDLHTMIHQLLLTMRGEFDRHRIAVTLDLRERPIIVDADTAQLQQVLANLLVNAIEATHQVEGRERVLHIVSRGVEGDQVALYVEDNGAGADAATYEHMFEPFFGTKPGGIGMGLAICRSIIESHGGTILARGRQPHGCSVIVTIPEQAGKIARGASG